MGLITTNLASCRDCYKCVRHCPVKAIRVTSGHAEVIENRCVADGRCVAVCPQKAKKFVSSIDKVKGFFAARLPVAASLAPSFVAAYPKYPLAAALRQLGFAYVAETAEGADLVAKAHRQAVAAAGAAGRGPVITSCCPVIVNLIEMYHPELRRYLADVVSPMVAHGKILKQRYGAAVKVVFIGPCIAKKGEIDTAAAGPEIDAVLTFQELNEMLQAAGIDPAELGADVFDGPVSLKAETFPTPGGLAHTVAMSTDLLARDIVSIDGMEESIAFLERFDETKDSLKLIELLACRGGCLAGPCMTGELSPMARRNRLLQETAGSQDVLPEETAPCEKCGPRRIWPAFKAVHDTVSEAEIRAILAKTGKYKPEDELNCGACGYDTCREKAKAVSIGMAEVDMCIPYMRQKAESRAHLICEMTPNAIFVVDREMRILEMNPAAENRFLCRQDKIMGQKLDVLFDPKYYVEALQTRQMVAGEVSYPNYGLVAWQIIFYVEGDDVVIGIYLDITAERQQNEQLSKVTAETLDKAQEVINKQMRVAQEIAGLLGETTAETKVLLTKLMNLFQKQ